MVTEDPPPQKGFESWFYHAPDMCNRYYRPKFLGYRRTPFGDDHRIKYITHFLDVRGQRVLELGPLEGHHSILLEKMGVKELISVEARIENLDKCQITKGLFNLSSTTFVYQNIESLYNGEQAAFEAPFDLVFCCGLLYHLPNPAKALQWFRTQSNSLFLGTHYYDPEHQHVDALEEATLTHHGAVYSGRKQKECPGDGIAGMSQSSFWVLEEDLFRMLKDSGYNHVHTLGKDYQNQSPHITVLAEA